MNSISWRQVGYIKRSVNRAKALELSQTPIMPSELGRAMKISLTHASKIIRELHSQKLIICLNDQLKVGRIYQITLVGKKVLKTIHEIKQ